MKEYNIIPLTNMSAFLKSPIHYKVLKPERGLRIERIQILFTPKQPLSENLANKQDPILYEF